VYGANNVVSIESSPNTTISAYALKTTACMEAGDNFTLGAGGFLSEGSQFGATGTLNFGATPGYYGIYYSDRGSSSTSINATAGVTFYGTGTGFSTPNMNIKGGVTFASGAWTLTPPTGSEAFQTTEPNALKLLSGAMINGEQGSKMTFASIEGGGTITESANESFTLTINGLNRTGSSTFSGSIVGAAGGAGNLIKTGTNTQVFAGLNNYNGTTTVSGGVLQGIQTSGTPFGMGSVTIGNGMLSLAPGGSGAAVALTGANKAPSDKFTFTAGAQVNLDKGSNTSLSYSIGNSAATANSVLVRGTNGTLIVAPASGTANLGSATGEKFIVNRGVLATNGIVSAAIIGQDSTTNKDGTFLAYDETNGLIAATYSDSNFAAAGTTSVEDVTSATAVNTRTVYALRASAALTLNASQTLTVGNNFLPAGVILNGGSISGGTALAFGTASGVLYSSVANGSIGSAITGSGGVSIVGPGVTTFSGTNTFSGGLFINNTTLSAGSNGNLGTAAGVLTLNGGTLQSTASFSMGTRAVALAIGTSNYGGAFDVASGTTLTAGGVVSGSGGLIKANAGTLTLSGANTFTGYTVVTGGTLKLAHSLALQSSTLTTGGTVFDSAVAAHAFTLGGLSDSGALSLMDNASNAVALSVGNNNSATTYAGMLSDTGSLLKIGSGTLTLSGASTYTGATSIQAGTLAVSSLNKVVGGAASSSLGAPTTSGSGTIAIGVTTTGATLSYVGSGETTDRVINQAGTTGGAALSANGTGALILTGNITATGAGIKTLTLGGASATNVLNEIQGVISDNSGTNKTSVTKNGIGTWVLSGSNSYTGATAIGPGGTLMLGAAGGATNTPLGTTAAGTSVSSGGVLDLNGFTLGTAEALTLSGDGLFGVGLYNNTSNTGALVNSSSTAASYRGLVTLAAESRVFAGNGDIILSNTGTITGAFTLTLDGTSTGSSVAGSIGNTTGGLIKDGPGTWILTGASTYTGATIVSAGTLVLDKTGAGALAATSALTLGGGIFQIKGASGGSTQTLAAFAIAANTNNVITLDPNNGTGVKLTLGNAWSRGNYSSMMFDYSSTNTGSRTVATAGATTGEVLSNGLYGWCLVKDSAGVTGFATRDGSGNISRFDDTTGTTLANNSNAGATNFTTLNSVYSSGTLAWSSGIATRSVNSLTIDTTNSGGTIDMGAVTNILMLTSQGVLFKGTNDEILTGGQVGAVTTEVIVHQTGSGLFTINSQISGVNGVLIKDGTGTLVVGAANTYDGHTTINAGVLKLGAAGGATYTPLGRAVGGTYVNIGGALDLNGFTLGTAEELTLKGTGVANGGALTNSSATAATYRGLVTLGADSEIVAGSGNIILANAGAITGTGFGLTLGGAAAASSIASSISTTAGSLTKVDSGTWTLSGTNTYTGTTTITQGTLQLGNAGTTGSLSPSSPITNNGTLAFNRTDTYGGAFSNTITGSGGINQAGTGTLTIAGSNSYTGATAVSAGKLVVNGSLANTTTIVASGATLGGYGSIGGATTISGTHNAGDAAVNSGVDSQEFGSSLSYAANSIFEWDLNANSTATGFDTVAAVGNIDVSTTATVFKVVFGAGVNLADTFWSSPYFTQSWSMASIFGKSFNSGEFASVISTADPATQGAFSISGSSLTWTAVPEPSSALTGILLGAGLLRRRRTKAR
jgi:autotransporter-associated beta strand protein